MKKIILILIFLLPLNLLSFDSYTEFGGYEVVRIDHIKQIDDEEGMLWFSSYDTIFGVNVADLSDAFVLDPKVEYWGSNEIHYIAEFAIDSKSTFYIGYNGQGLLTYNEKSGYTLYNSDNSDLISDTIVDVFLDKDEYLWIKTSSNNYQRFKDGMFESFESYVDYPGEHPGYNHGLSVNYNGEFYTVTSESNLISWDGEKWKDHNVVSPEGNGYEMYKLRVLDGKLWIGTIDAIINYDGSTFDSIRVGVYFDPVFNIFVKDFAIDKVSGALWTLISFDTWEFSVNYLLKFVDKKMEKMILLNGLELFRPNKYNYLQSMVIDKNGKLYLATNRYGLVVYDPSLSSVDMQVIVDKSLILGTIKPNPMTFESELDFFCHPEHIAGIRFRLYDYIGREVKEYIGSHEYSPATARGTLRLDKAGLMSGLYFLNVSAGNESETRPIIVE